MRLLHHFFKIEYPCTLLYLSKSVPPVHLKSIITQRHSDRFYLLRSTEDAPEQAAYRTKENVCLVVFPAAEMAATYVPDFTR